MLTNQTLLTWNNPTVISTFPFNENANKFLLSFHPHNRPNQLKQLSVLPPVKPVNMEKACYTTVFPS